MFKVFLMSFFTVVILTGAITSKAEQVPIFNEPFPAYDNEKLIGRWDKNGGAISFFVRQVDGKKQARMLTTDESGDVKFVLDLRPVDVEDIEELLEDTLKKMGNPDTLPIPPLGTREVTTMVGKLIYPVAEIRTFIVDPAGTQRYVMLRIKGKKGAKFEQNVYWMDRPDLKSLEKLMDKVLDETGES